MTIIVSNGVDAPVDLSRLASPRWAHRYQVLGNGAAMLAADHLAS